MDRVFDKAFSQAHAGQSAAMERETKVQQPTACKETEQVADAISRILNCWKNKEYFMLMQLEEPTADELGRPLWPCTSGDVSKAYRKMSVLVHPDKNPGEDARKAFEALNEAHRILKDPGRLEEVMRDAAIKAVRERERLEACASAEERVFINAAKNVRAKELRKEEGKSFQETIMAQTKRRQEEAKWKAEAASRSRALELQQAEEEEKEEKAKAAASTAPVKKGGFGPARPPNRGGMRGGVVKKGREEVTEEDSEDEDRLQIAKKKKRPTFM